MSSSVLLLHPEPANVSDPSASCDSRIPNPSNRHILFVMTFRRWYNLRPDKDATLSERGQVRLAIEIWKTYSESDKVRWKDCAKDAAERHAEIFPGFRFQSRTHDEKEQDEHGEEAKKDRVRFKKPYRRVSKQLSPFGCAATGNKCSTPVTLVHRMALPIYHARSLLLSQDDDASVVTDSVPEIAIEGLHFDDMWGYNDIGVGLDSLLS